MRSGVSASGEEFRIVAVPMTDLGNFALVLGPAAGTDQHILSSLWVVLIIFGGTGVVAAGMAGRPSPDPACGRCASWPTRWST